MIEDVTKVLLDTEQGSPFTVKDLLFSGYDDGNVFSYEDPAAADYTEMYSRYGKARQVEQALTLPVRQCNYAIERGNKGSEEIAAFVTEVLTTPQWGGGMSTPLERVIAQMTGAFTTRKAYFEKVVTVKNDRQVYDKIAWRPPSTCAVVRDGKTGSFQGFKQMPVRMEDNNEIWVKASEAFVYIHGQHRDPLQGISDMDITYWCYQTQQKIRFLWYQFLEGQSLPKTIVKNQDETEANKTAKKIATLRQGGIVGVGASNQVDAFESSGKGAEQFQQALKWLDGEASSSVLGGFLDLASQASAGAGSLALSRDASDFFLMSRQADTREMQGDINHFLIRPLVAWNFGVDAPCPEFTFAPLSEHDADQAFSLLTAVATVPQTSLPDEFLHELIEKVAGYLDIDVDKVRAGLESAKYSAEQKAAKEAKSPQAQAVAGVAGAVDAASRAVERVRPTRAA